MCQKSPITVAPGESGRSKQSKDGWAYWETHSATVTELTSWVVIATASGLQYPKALPGDESVALLKQRLARDLTELVARQRPGGGWTPIRAATAEEDTRTYSTLMAVWALLEGKRVDGLDSPSKGALDEALRSGARWLLETRHPVRDWVPNPRRKDAQTEYFPGLTAQVIFVLSELAKEDVGAFLRNDTAFLETKDRFLRNWGPNGTVNELDTRIPDGDVHLSVNDFVLEGSTFLGFPWTFAAVCELAHDAQLPSIDRAMATRQWIRMALRADAVNAHVLASHPYVTSENLFALSKAVLWAPKLRTESPRERAR